MVRVRRGIGILMLVEELLFFLLKECPQLPSFQFPLCCAHSESVIHSLQEIKIG